MAREQTAATHRPALRMLAAGLAIVAAFAAFFLLGLDEHLTLTSLQARHADLAALMERDPTLLVAGFALLYIVLLALSLPGAVLTLSLAAGAIFGLLLGTIIVAAATAVGSSLAFLGARYFARGLVEKRFGPQLAAVDRGIAKDGALYLLALRLMAAVPHYLINLGMGLSRMPLATFALVSMVGVLPSTLIYVNAGTELAKIEQASDILSAELLGSLALLGLLPLVGRWALRRFRPVPALVSEQAAMEHR